MERSQCPNCGDKIEFKIGASLSVVCKSCGSVVARSGQSLESLGKVSAVVSTDSTLSVGDKVECSKKIFLVLGLVIYGHPLGGRWTEYYVHFEDDTVGWVSEAQGRFVFLTEVDVQDVRLPGYAELRPMLPVFLGSYGVLVVSEVNEGSLLCAEGELPFLASPNIKHFFADLSSSHGQVASLEYDDVAKPPRVYLGIETRFDALKRHGVNEANPMFPGDNVANVHNFNCLHCGAPIPLAALGKTMRVACKYCGALSDLEQNQVLVLQEKWRSELLLPLGAKGTLEGIEWVIAGYMQRKSSFDGEEFSWDEFLLYHAVEGFRWLVIDDGIFRFGRFLSASEIQFSEHGSRVMVQGKTYRLRHQSRAEVSFVLGEFYWKVSLGETVDAADYESGPWLLSSEKSDNEINWTLSYPLSRSKVMAAFSGERSADQSESKTSLLSTKLMGLFVILTIFVLFCVVASSCGDCDESAPSGIYGGAITGAFGGSGGRGFGGK